MRIYSIISLLMVCSVHIQAQNCLLTYQDKYDQLLPLEMIKKHFWGDMSKAKKEYTVNKTPKYRNHDTYAYSWPSDRTRTMKLMGKEMTVPVSNRIGLTWVGDDMFKMSKNKSDLENFRFFYRNLTQKELDEAFGKAEKQVENKTNATKEQKAAGMGIAKDMAAATKFENVAGVGEAAVWKLGDNELIVLFKGYTFQVIADVSKDKATNLELAKKLAAEVVAKCK
ncbi:hypothetical protein [Runella salmonicolor]|uniref:DUF4136 domain-containing protein n=1 Tax=Runella salmonicolor TaxID=2950278 RepID=A0ABT1FQ21_9BACT|nr:hypothetical protein [Runella salmonicolor]MCP1383860.1 hypothetical protein [Runella salmonicolor]